MSCSRYKPETSATNVGCDVVAPVSDAVLPPGLLTKLQA
jgi:hypothetical protein